MTNEMLAEMPMYAPRGALQFTQQQLGVKQAAISKMERRPDHLISTLRRIPTIVHGERRSIKAMRDIVKYLD